jgi:hypothetical protein
MSLLRWLYSLMKMLLLVMTKSRIVLGMNRNWAGRKKSVVNSWMKYLTKATFQKAISNVVGTRSIYKNK